MSKLIFVMVMLLGWVGAAHADVFAVTSGKDRLALTCQGAGVTDTSCSIAMGQGSPGEAMPVRFTTKPTRYAHLLKVGIEKAVESKRPSFPLDARDISLLRGLALDKCHPGADESADLFQLCMPGGSSSSVVLFARGACDRCDFEPYVLRKR